MERFDKEKVSRYWTLFANVSEGRNADIEMEEFKELCFEFLSQTLDATADVLKRLKDR